jgi:16S rRNA (cytosine1402-N4)-methyltransferase
MKNPETNLQDGQYHVPVLLQLTIEALNVVPGKWYIDCTLGGGGHTSEILKSGGKVIGIDQDQSALDFVTEKLQKHIQAGYLILTKTNFNALEEVASKHQKAISGVLFDLGFSSHQVGSNQRGFSFQTNEFLDMRMDPQTQTTTASDLVNRLPERELYKIIYKYGEDPLSQKIAHLIVTKRQERPITKTMQLAEIINNLYQHTYKNHSRTHPATKTFQALRIVVNNELDNFKNALAQAQVVLEPKGRIAVISFHSLEDRITKRAFQDWQRSEIGVCLTKKPLTASDEELKNNVRARSAKLRVFEKHEKKTK